MAGLPTNIPPPDNKNEARTLLKNCLKDLSPINATISNTWTSTEADALTELLRQFELLKSNIQGI